MCWQDPTRRREDRCRSQPARSGTGMWGGSLHAGGSLGAGEVDRERMEEPGHAFLPAHPAVPG